MNKKIIGIFVSMLFIGASIVSGVNIQLNDIIKFESNTRGNILYVGGNGPYNYSKIQDAIDNASDGDIIRVFNGTYYENLVVNKTLSFFGDDKSDTIIHGKQSSDIFYITKNYVIIENFTITNGSDGIEFYSCHNNIVKNCYIINNLNRGIHLQWSNSNSIFNCDLNNNGLQGIRCYISKFNMITNNCNIQNNGGTGINLYSSCRGNMIKNCNISNNAHGIWIDSDSDANTICYCIFNNNSYEAIEIYRYSFDMNIHHNNFINNNNGNKQAFDAGTSASFWYESYPSGGNYWSDFDEPDEGAYDNFSGPFQNISGADGIVDIGGIPGGRNPYIIPNKHTKD